MRVQARSFAAALSAALPLLAQAVYIDPAGLGQALLYPYYTVQVANGDTFNTYLSIVNHAADGKALRVRFREGRAGAEALQFNLFLAPLDAWTAALVPDGSGGARLISVDRSCNNATGSTPIDTTLRNPVPNDGLGADLSRTREGFVEVLEMASITDAAVLAAIAPGSSTCATVDAALAGGGKALAPSGGVSGSLTLINVANALNFTLNAEALDHLASRAYYRSAPESVVGFDAPEIDRVSVVLANGSTYRSTWTRGADAVSAVLMRDRAYGEYVLDAATASRTEVVVTTPTRHFYDVYPGVGNPVAGSRTAPFTGRVGWAADCAWNTAQAMGEALDSGSVGREGQGFGPEPSPVGFPEPPPPPTYLCAEVGVAEVTMAAGVPSGPTPLLGSSNRGLVALHAAYENGWVWMRRYGNDPGGLVSGTDSTRATLATGATVSGSHRYYGVPLLGFTARSFTNGTLACSSGRCVGNYGGALPLHYRIRIDP